MMFLPWGLPFSWTALEYVSHSLEFTFKQPIESSVEGVYLVVTGSVRHIGGLFGFVWVLEKV